MTTEKKINPIAMKMALEKRLSDLNAKLADIKEKNPNLLSLEEAQQIQEQYAIKKQEYVSQQKEAQRISAQIGKLEETVKSKSKHHLVSEKKHLYDLANNLKKQMEENECELDRLGKKIDTAIGEENTKFISLTIDRDKIKKKLEEIVVDQKEYSDFQSKMQALEKKSSPFGPVIINKNLFETISKSADWQKEFLNKHKLDFKEDKTEGTIQLISQEKDIQIEVSKEKISGQWSKEKESSAISMMVELYLKAIENQKVDKHKVESKDPESTKQIELELAKQLKSKGMAQCEINDKKIEQILNPKVDDIREESSTQQKF